MSIWPQPRAMWNLVRKINGPWLGNYDIFRVRSTDFEQVRERRERKRKKFMDFINYKGCQHRETLFWDEKQWDIQAYLMAFSNCQLYSNRILSCLYFLMLRITLFFIVLCFAHSQDYFAGLNIDPILVNSTNNAINILKTSLSRNFDCQQQMPQFGPLPNVNLFGGRFLQFLQQSYQYKNFFGFGGYAATQPSITCASSPFRNTVFQQIYQQVIDVTQLLQKVKSWLIQYNNVVIGNNNTVNGTDNVVIGSSNSLTGSNDWVFTSNYQSTDPTNGVLIIQTYLIQLQDITLIPSRPQSAIKCIPQEQSNQQFNVFWSRSIKNHRFCL